MHAAIERYRSHPSHSSPIAMQVQLLEYVEDIARMLAGAPAYLETSGRSSQMVPRAIFGALYRFDRHGKKS